MAADAITRKFAMSYDDLAARAENLYLAGVRDVALLSEYAIDTAFMTAFYAKLNACIALKPDDVWVLEVAWKNEMTYLATAQVRTIMKTIAGRAAMVFGENSLRHKMFRTEALGRMTTERLVTTAINVKAKATEFMTELATRGMTTDILDDLDAAVAAMTAKRQEANNHNDARRMAAQARVIAYNSLYDDMKTIAAAGKLKYAESSPARYADYLLYDPAEGAKTPPDAPVITSIQDGILTLEADETATSHQVQESLNGTDWDFVEETLHTNTCPVEAPGEGEKYFRARSRNDAGFSAWSTVSILLAMLEAPSAPGFNASAGTFGWGAAAGATLYRMRYRAVGSTGEYTEVLADNILTYTWTPPVGEWEFQVRAESGTNVSPWVTFYGTVS